MINLIIKVISIVVLVLPRAYLEAEASDQTYTIGFGSCITEKREQPIWKAIKEENIDEFFFMGDNVYGDSDDGLLIEMKESYKKQKNMFPDWVFSKKLNAIWDDHDYGKNDGGFEYPLKQQAQAMFLEFWKVAKDDPRHLREGIYFNEEKEIFGRTINLIALDTRYHRCLLYTSPSPRDATLSRMPSSA